MTRLSSKFVIRGLALSCALAAFSPAYAQENDKSVAADESQTEGGEIIVTAQRRAERLQDVPIAITALGNEALTERAIRTAVDLAGTVPGLSFTGFSGINATNLISMRGLAGQPVPIGASQATGVYLDGVYLARPDSGFFSLRDVERVEVLRGPQGTLYGRNVTAGAINIITRTPSDQMEGKIDASYGNYNTVSAGGYVSGPIAGKLSASISGTYDRHDGYYINKVTGNEIGKFSAWSGRGKLRYDNDAGFDATFTVDYSKRNSVDLFTLGSVVAGKQVFSTKFVNTDAEDYIGSHMKSRGLSLLMNFDVGGNVTVTSITSYRKFDFFTIYDLDATPNNIITASFTNSNDSFSQEVRAAYEGDRLKIVAGANYFNEQAMTRLRAVNTYAQLNRAYVSAHPDPESKSDLNAMAVFSQVEYEVVDKVTLVGGLRLNYEKRDFSVDYSKGRGVTPASPTVIGSLSDTALLPSAGINFKANPDLLIYAKYSKGYQAPGFAYQVGNKFNAENLNVYEGGFKAQLLDRRVTLNVAGFYYDYKDIQLRRFVSDTLSLLENAGTGSIKGAEAELIVRPLPGLSLNGQVTYSKAIYTKYCEGITAGTPQNNDPFCIVGKTANRAGNALNNAPRWSGGFGANYVAELGGDMKLTLNGNYSFETESYFTAANLITISDQGWHRIDASASLAFGNGLEVFAYGRNLDKDRHVAQASAGAGGFRAVISDPRTYGMGLRYKF